MKHTVLLVSGPEDSKQNKIQSYQANQKAELDNFCWVTHSKFFEGNTFEHTALMGQTAQPLWQLLGMLFQQLNWPEIPNHLFRRKRRARLCIGSIAARSRICTCRDMIWYDLIQSYSRETMTNRTYMIWYYILYNIYNYIIYNYI